MPLRVQLLVMVALTALPIARQAAAQQEPTSGYRLRSERGQSRRLQVADGQETSAASTSLSDEQPGPDGGQETGDRRQETGDRRQETGDRRQETGDRRQETGDRRQETGDRRQETEVKGQRSGVGGRGSQIEAPTLSVNRAANDKPPMKLAPRSESGGRRLAKPATIEPTGAVGTVAGSLAVVLGLFVVVVWISRRLAPAGSAALPKEAVELLGRMTVSGQHALQLVRVGGRLLLVALSPHGAATLTEILDPSEVERLTSLCLRQRPGSASASFQQTVTQLEREPSGRSFVEERRPVSGASARGARTSSRA